MWAKGWPALDILSVIFYFISLCHEARPAIVWPVMDVVWVASSNGQIFSEKMGGGGGV